MVTDIQETVEELNKLEELMKHNIYMRSITTSDLIERTDIKALDLGTYFMNLNTEFDVLRARHDVLDNKLREFCMSRYMPEN